MHNKTKMMDYPRKHAIYSVHVALSCPKELYHLRIANIFRITVVVADWLD